jgi:hypothetical protein
MVVKARSQKNLQKCTKMQEFRHITDSEQKKWHGALGEGYNTLKPKDFSILARRERGRPTTLK